MLVTRCRISRPSAFLLITIVGLSLIGGCSNDRQETQNSSTFLGDSANYVSGPLPLILEDGTPAVEREPDHVTRQAREFFVDWLKDHGETSIVDDETGVGIEGTPTRLWAFQYGFDQEDSRCTAEVEFRVVLPDGREIQEFVIGLGDSEEAAVGMAIANFTLSTFHVVYSVFMNTSDPHMNHENIMIADDARVLTAGDIIAIGEDISEFDAVRDRIKEELSASGLSNHVHWVKVVYGRSKDEVFASSVTVDNGDFAFMNERMNELNWPIPEEYYMARQFLVIQPAAPVAP